ncbi:response regulator [Zhongshania sp.]|jgi:sigma-B regulation protein RsbU (phosphoserine phosphatase)|uniref:response regulator n=1 Tax=Zhongshania sp. TaxID=1971902 RepID=UPI002A81BF3B|nr:response regulator [Zhongshania sp.]
MEFFEKNEMLRAGSEVKVTVLVVEDNRVERMRLQAVLQSMGMAPILAENATEALRFIKKRKVDIVLSDWLMPGMTGLEFCQRLAEDEDLGRPYFIMLTGRNASVDLIAAMDAGADDYIAKPAWREELRVRLQAGVRSLNRAGRRHQISSTPGLVWVDARA